MTINKILLVIAIIFFVLAGLHVSLGLDLVPWGLALFAGSFIP